MFYRRTKSNYMAHLEVRPKKGTPWWVWLLLVAAAIAILLFFMRRCDSSNMDNDRVDDTLANTELDTANVLASTEPNWNNVDFNTPISTDSDISDDAIEIRNHADYTIFSIGENILFPTDGNEIQANATDKLMQVAVVLNKRFEGAYIGVFGNTDSTGTTVHNTALGAERANAVKNWLVEKGSLNVDKISVHSLGENAPVADNQTAAGRKQNRNVEIVVFKTKP